MRRANRKGKAMDRIGPERTREYPVDVERKKNPRGRVKSLKATRVTALGLSGLMTKVVRRTWGC